MGLLSALHDSMNQLEPFNEQPDVDELLIALKQLNEKSEFNSTILGNLKIQLNTLYQEAERGGNDKLAEAAFACLSAVTELDDMPPPAYSASNAAATAPPPVYMSSSSAPLYMSPGKSTHPGASAPPNEFNITFESWKSLEQGERKIELKMGGTTSPISIIELQMLADDFYILKLTAGSLASIHDNTLENNAEKTAEFQRLASGITGFDKHDNEFILTGDKHMITNALNEVMNRMEVKYGPVFKVVKDPLIEAISSPNTHKPKTI